MFHNRPRLPELHVMSLAGHVKDVFDSDLFIEFRMQMALTDRRAVTESTLIDLMLLSQADYFVGTFSSGEMLLCIACLKCIRSLLYLGCS